MATSTRRLTELGLPPALAKEVASIEPATKAAAVTQATSADASDLATAITLVNELKADFNALVAALKA